MKQRGEVEVLVALLAGLALVLTAIVFIGLKVDEIACKSRWEESGMAVRWSFWGGCQVEVQKGRWLPEERVREIDLPKKGN